MSYRVSTAHPFHDLTRLIVGREVRMGDTVVFVSAVDLSAVEQLREQAPRGRRPSYTAFVAKAAGIALKEFPYANCRLVRRWLPFLRSRLQRFDSADIAVAIERDLPDTPVAAFIDILRDANHATLEELTARLRTFSEADVNNNRQWRLYRWLAEHLPPWLSSLLISAPVRSPRHWAKYRGGSTMISSPAKYGVDTVIGAWPATSGISFGLVKDRAVVCDGRVVARPTFDLSLNFDRRVMAGAQAARFFKRIVELIEHADVDLASRPVALAPEETDAATPRAVAV